MREDIFNFERYKTYLSTVEGGMDVLVNMYGEEAAKKKEEKEKKEAEKQQ